LENEESNLILNPTLQRQPKRDKRKSGGIMDGGERQPSKTATGARAPMAV